MPKLISPDKFGMMILEYCRPYLGKKEYGDLRFSDRALPARSPPPQSWVAPKGGAGWALWYETPGGSTDFIPILLNPNGTYWAKRSKLKTRPVKSPEEAIGDLGKIIAAIPQERWEDLKLFAKLRKEEGATLEKSLDEVRRLSERRYGPTKSEVNRYEKYCRGDLYKRTSTT